MTDLEKLVAKTQNKFCVKETTTKTSYYNCFGDKIDENIKVTSELYLFKEDKETGIYKWIKGNEEDK